MINLSLLSALTNNLQNIDPKNLPKILKFVSVDVLKNLGDGKFLIDIEGKQQEAQSQKPLQENTTYFARYQQTKNATTPTVLSKLIKLPHLAKQLQQLQEFALSTKELHTLLKNPTQLQEFKNSLLHKLIDTPSKEQFLQLSHLLLSLEHNVLTFPFYFQEYLGIFQLKKRYNKKTKKTALEFYALLEQLGALSGVVYTDKVVLHVAYDEIKEFLEQQEKELAITLEISVVDAIEPLFDITPTNQLLDIKT